MPFINGMSTISPHTTYIGKGLVFQFILAQFFLVRSELVHISQLITQLQSGHMGALQEISKVISHLVGASQVEMRIYDWSGDGILTKFKEYSAQFVIRNEKKNKDAEALFKFATEFWHIGLKTQDFVRSKLKSNLSNSSCTELIRSKNKMSTLLSQICDTFKRLFFIFNQDENVIFFLLRNYEVFSELYGPWFFNDLFDKMYEYGAKGAQKFLVDSYTRKGFAQLTPIINSKFNEILSKQPCPQ